MTPYYTKGGITIYHGDARVVVPTLGMFDTCLTDPVWPNARVPLAGHEDPHGLLRETLAALGTNAHRLAIHLGCDSDPRFLSAVPAHWKFFRVAWLEYVRPHYKGPLMYTSDVAYLYGQARPSWAKARVIPGRMMLQGNVMGKPKPAIPRHPTPRHFSHVEWLVKWWGGRASSIPSAARARRWWQLEHAAHRRSASRSTSATVRPLPGGLTAPPTETYPRDARSIDAPS